MITSMLNDARIIYAGLLKCCLLWHLAIDTEDELDGPVWHNQCFEKKKATVWSLNLRFTIFTISHIHVAYYMWPCLLIMFTCVTHAVHV